MYFKNVHSVFAAAAPDHTHTHTHTKAHKSTHKHSLPAVLVVPPPLLAQVSLYTLLAQYTLAHIHTQKHTQTFPTCSTCGASPPAGAGVAVHTTGPVHPRAHTHTNIPYLQYLWCLPPCWCRCRCTHYWPSPPSHTYTRKSTHKHSLPAVLVVPPPLLVLVSLYTLLAQPTLAPFC